MSRFQELKDLFKQRLINAARGDLFAHFERSISGVEKEIDHKRKLLDLVLNPDTKQQRAECPADVQQQLESKEEVPPEQQERSSSLDQEDPEPPHIKEEQEELWTSQDGEQLQGLQEADIIKFTFTPVPEKTEDGEEEPQSSQLHQSQAEQMEAEADEENCGGSEPARNSDPDRHLQSDTDEKASDSYEPDTDDGESETEGTEELEETSDPQSESELKSDISSNPGKKSLICPVCGKQCCHRANLIIHQRKHTGERPFSCSVCGKRFSSKGSLVKHKTIHTAEKPFKCSVCGKSFKHSILYYHMKTHTGERPFSCTVCGKGFIQRARLLYHMRIHTGDTPFKCSICGKKYAHRVNLNYHLTIHTGEKPFHCTACNNRFRYRSALKNHKCPNDPSPKPLSEQRKKPTKFHECSECGKKYTNKANLTIHQRSHTGEKPYGCSLCGERFICKGTLERHKYRHKGEKPFSCSICGKSFTQSGLEYHMKAHKGQRAFSCSVCGKSFIQKSSMNVHMKIHTGEKPFSCSLCGKEYAHKVNLKYHMTLHTGERPFNCSVCKRRFILKSELKRHKCVDRTLPKHPNAKCQKSLSCSECDATFPSLYLLKAHMRTHKGLKVYTCSVCGLVLGTKTHLETHMGSHTLEKQYRCSVCGKAYKHRRGLAKHMTIHPEGERFRCHDCGEGYRWQYQLKIHDCPAKSSQQSKEGFNENDCRGVKRSRTSDPDRHLQPDTDKKPKVSFQSDNSADIQSGFTNQKTKDISVSDKECNTKPFSSSDDKTESKTGDSVHSDVCKQTRQPQSDLNDLKTVKGSVSAYSCSVFGKKITQRGIMQHMVVHSGKKPVRCSDCNETFFGHFQIKTHKCRGGSLQESKAGFTNEDCGGSKQAKKLDPDRHSKQDTDEKTLASFETNGSTNISFWKETRQHQSGVTYQRNKDTPVSDEGCKTDINDDKAKFTLESELRSPECDGESAQLHQSQTKEQITDRGEHFTGEETFHCSVCNKGFSESTSLVKHMRIHTDQKPFTCSICREGFTWRRHLTKHMEVHTDSSISCSQCGRKFDHERQLRSHIITHTRKKPFSCSVCGEKFAKCERLKIHMRCHRKKKLKEADITSTPDPVKSEDDEEKPQPSLLHQRQTEQMEAEADGEDCGGSEPARNSHPDRHLQPDTDEKTSDCSEPDTDDSDFWKETRQHPTHTEIHEEAKQEDPEPPHIKEEQQVLRTNQEGEQLQGLQEADIKVKFSPDPVKSEDNEEKPQPSQLHQRQTEQMKTEADGEDCGGSEPARNSHPDRHLQPDTDEETLHSSEPDTDDSDFWI